MQELVLKKTLRRDGWCVLDGEDLIFQFNESILLAGDKNCIIRLRMCTEPNLSTCRGLKRSGERQERNTRNEDDKHNCICSYM